MKLKKIVERGLKWVKWILSGVTVLSVVLLVGCGMSGASSISVQEERLEEIDVQLEQLAHITLRGGTGAIGYRSYSFENPEHPLWIEVDLEEEQRIDQVVLVPALRRDRVEGFQADAMPQAFRIRVGSHENPEGEVVVDFGVEEREQMGIAPVVLSFPERSALWVRIENSRLSLQAFNRLYALRLSEILVFSGGRNVALRQPVTSSDEEPPDPSGAWGLRFLVDGLTPYLMDSVLGGESRGYISNFGESPELRIDLGKPYPISEVHLHAIEQSATVPQAFIGDLGVPRHFKVEGALLEDFSDAQVMVEYQSEKIYDTGPVMAWNISETLCRYVRVVTIGKNISFGSTERLSRIGFSEIVLVSDDENVARGKQAWVVPEGTNARAPSALTDGMNLYGSILPLRQWVNELALRQQLESQREEISKVLSMKYARQKSALAWMRWIAAALVVLIGFIVIYSRMLSIRQETRIRERIAANLHDELGANLHAIGMLSDLARESVATPDFLDDTLDRIRGLSERTGAAARYCTNMLEAEGICENLIDEMKREASRLLSDLEYELVFEGEAELNQLSRRRRIDLFLFYKEALVNIIRHGHASEAKVRLQYEADRVVLTIEDNGSGFSGDVPASLKRRARLMRADAKAEVIHPDAGGTLIRLQFNAKSWSLLKL